MRTVLQTAAFSHSAISPKICLAGRDGLEPPPAGLESAVLPLTLSTHWLGAGVSNLLTAGSKPTVIPTSPAPILLYKFMMLRLERIERIELSSDTWQASVLPLNYIRLLVPREGVEPSRQSMAVTFEITVSASFTISARLKVRPSSHSTFTRSHSALGRACDP